MPKDIYNSYFNSFMGNPMGFFEGMFAEMDRRKKEQRNINAGIQEANGFYGVPEKIDFKYDMLDFNGKFYIGRANELYHLFDSSGKFLFSCEEFDYLGKDMFIQYVDKEPKKGQSSVYGALCKDGIRLSEYEFRSKFLSKFNKDSDFCVLGYEDFSHECVINTEGKVVLKTERSFDNIYLQGNIAHTKNAYYNLFTGEIICSNTKSSTLGTKELLFVETYDDQVYKIDKRTCEFEVFGESKQKPHTNDVKLCGGSDVTVKEIIPVLPKQNRNELCRCGSGLKVKKCNCVK